MFNPNEFIGNAIFFLGKNASLNEKNRAYRGLKKNMESVVPESYRSAVSYRYSEGISDDLPATMTWKYHATQNHKEG